MKKKRLLVVWVSVEPWYFLASQYFVNLICEVKFPNFKLASSIKLANWMVKILTEELTQIVPVYEFFW